MTEDRRANEIEVSADEERFLRRFVRRELLPWLAGVAALAALALGAALHAPIGALADSAPGSERAWSETTGLDSAALAELRAENARLRADLGALEPRLRELFESRLARLEGSVAARTTSVSRETAGDTAPKPLGDPSAIRERLYNLEMRQDRKEQERAALQQDVLARLYELERVSQAEASARLENLQSGEQRVEKLELRVGQLEHQRGPESVPAAPAAPQ